MNKLTGLMATFLLALCAPLAHADFLIAYQIGSGPIFTCLDNADNTNLTGTTSCSSPTVDGVTIANAGGTSNSPGTPDSSYQFGSTTTIIANGSVAPDTEVTLWFAAQDFNTPVTPPDIDYSSEVGLSANGGSAAATLVSCVDTTDAGVGADFCPSAAAGGTLTNTIPTFTGSANNTVYGLITGLPSSGGNYSLAQELTVTLGANTNVGFSSNQYLTPVPEPASLILLGSGLLGACFVLRRKMQTKRA
jgi:PEP-CTERM motif